MVRPYRDDVCMYLLLGSCRTDRNRNAYIHRIREELKPGRASLAGASRGAQQESALRARGIGQPLVIRQICWSALTGKPLRGKSSLYLGRPNGYCVAKQ